ncbi:unknown [Clostridium sp. CAG:729]|nr:unknown [Clostridium sp. CAG:729]
MIIFPSRVAKSLTIPAISFSLPIIIELFLSLITKSFRVTLAVISDFLSSPCNLPSKDKLPELKINDFFKSDGANARKSPGSGSFSEWIFKSAVESESIWPSAFKTLPFIYV